MRAALPLLLATAALAACGGEAETVTVTVTETVTETVEADASGEDDRAQQLAHDVCEAIPPGFLAPFLGADADDPERLGEEFSLLVRPELQDPAREGCAAGAAGE